MRISARRAVVRSRSSVTITPPCGGGVIRQPHRRVTVTASRDVGRLRLRLLKSEEIAELREEHIAAPLQGAGARGLIGA